MEKWKDVSGYEGLYQVSNEGMVKSFKKGKEKMLKLYKDKYGYYAVKLSKDGKHKFYYVHRLVAQEFVYNDNLFFNQINHKDEVKTNNKADNLEWCDSTYNNNYGTAIYRRIETRSRKVICVETGIIYQSANEIERLFGFWHSKINNCCNGKQKTAYGYHWKHVV